ncbi:conserved exported hypothetical protein [Candidatus Sulfopaludibacter sp. SbA3]|nr:conserved exported hypothetical protein [Candidatus Sulfopaludibacter sp. SbA3]
MPYRLTFLFVLAALALPGAAKKTATATGENDELILTATLYIDQADIKDLVGSDLDGHYFVASVKIQPKYGKTVTIDRDDFLLRCFDGNDTSRPFIGSQIAGQSTMVVGKVMEDEGKKSKPRITMGGMGGLTGPMGQYDNAPAKVKENPDAKMTTLEKTLDEKILPEGKSDAPVSGLLYFAMEKHKMKDMELTYGAKETRISLHFK